MADVAANVSGPQPRVHERRLWVGMVLPGLAAVGLLSGCLGDPPPDPETAPLEIVVGSRERPEEPCLLNRSEVAAGTHELLLVAASAPATVTIRDGSGSVVFERDVTAGAGEASTAIELPEGRFVIECAQRGAQPSKATLTVVPASPDGE